MDSFNSLFVVIVVDLIKLVALCMQPFVSLGNKVFVSILASSSILVPSPAWHASAPLARRASVGKKLSFSAEEKKNLAGEARSHQATKRALCPILRLTNSLFTSSVSKYKHFWLWSR